MVLSEIRRIAEALYFKSKNSIRYDCWKVLEQTQYLPADRLLAIQRKRLQRLMMIAYHQNAFYRKRFDDAGVVPQDIKEPDDLKKLPILTKSQIRNNTDQMISSGYVKTQLMRHKTGGSTGKALELFISEPCSEFRNALAKRNDRWSGWEAGEPVAAIWGNPVFPKGVKRRILGWLLSPTIYLDTMAVSEDSVVEFVKQWRKVQPTLVFGHAHSIYLLAQYLERLAIRDVRPKGIISSSMMLLPHERMLIEKFFKTRVTNRYGCEEVSLIASECERHEGMHLNIEHLVIEVLREDGTDALPGEPGRIVVTDLMNFAMPFVRYQVEDVGVLSEKKCSCGRALPLLDHVAGRMADFLIREDSSQVAGISLIENTLTKISGLEQMQIVQEDMRHIDINLVPATSFGDDNKKALVDYLKLIFGQGTAIHINMVKQILPEPSGKYRFSICRIPNQN